MSFAPHEPRTPITLEAMRVAANKFLIATAAGMTLVCTAVAAIGAQNIPINFLISALATVSAFAAGRFYGTALPARLAIATALAVQVMMLIFAASALDGSHVQEAHMIYFVLNCYLLSYACWRSLLVYNIVVVAHHFVLTFLHPAWVWTSDPATTGLSHLAIHAGIATILVGPLMFVAVQLHDMINNTHAALSAAGRATLAANANAEKAEQSRLATIAERQKAEAERAGTAAAQNEVVTALAAGLSQLAAGNFVQRLSGSFAPEYETLRADFNATVSQLQASMAQLRDRTTAIRGGTAELAAATDSLARRTEEQAANLEEAAAALQVVTTTMRNTAVSAGAARDAVAVAKSDSERSRDVLEKSIGAMSAIEGSAREIGSIIGVIDEIAFQTNLLALNAGVEAARAGDAGRGFAVVATEVRALAQRSADAAKQIKALISASGQQVESGVKLVGETGHVLADISGQVAKLAGVITEIAAATQEQTGGLATVNATVSQMDLVTQRDAALVEQAAAATAALSQEASQLEGLAARFQVNEGAAPRGAHRALELAGG